jgi:hypothetical protein
MAKQRNLEPGQDHTENCMKEFSVHHLYLLRRRIQDSQQAESGKISHLQPHLVHSGQVALFVYDSHELVNCLLAHYCLSETRAGHI